MELLRSSAVKIAVWHHAARRADVRLNRGGYRHPGARHGPLGHQIRQSGGRPSPVELHEGRMTLFLPTVGKPVVSTRSDLRSGSETPVR